GEQHAQTVARSCAAAGLRVKVVALPGLQDKQDVSDFLAAHSMDELLACVTRTPAWTPATAPSVWTRAKTAAEFLAEPGRDFEWLDYPLCARGAITEINAPRGTGKSIVILARVVALAQAGRRILYADRDNAPATLRRRLTGLRTHD